MDRRGWWILAVLWFVMIVAMAFPLYGMSVVSPRMAADLGFNHKSLGLMYTVFLLVLGLPGPLVAVLINRVGVRLVIVAGCAFIALGSLGMALLVQNLWQGVLAFGVVGVGVSMTAMVPAQTAVVDWFDRNRALGLAILNSASGVGGVFAVRALDYTVQTSSQGWRAGWSLLATLAVVACLLSALVIRERHDRKKPVDASTPARPEIQEARAQAGGARKALFSGAFWRLQLAFVPAAISSAFFAAHGVIHFTGQGFDAGKAATFMATMTGSLLLGKLVIGVLGDRMQIRYLWTAFIVGMALGIAMAIRPQHDWQLYAAAVLIGSGTGSASVGMSAILSKYYDRSIFSSLMGYSFAVFTLVGAVFPLLAGGISDRIGSYAPAFYLAVAICLAGAACLYFTPRPGREGIAGER